MNIIFCFLSQYGIIKDLTWCILEQIWRRFQKFISNIYNMNLKFRNKSRSDLRLLLFLCFLHVTTCVCSVAAVSRNNFTFLNHFTVIYDNFWSVFDWSIDYKSVALPIELWGLEELNKIKHYILQVKYALLANEDEC